MGTIKFILTTNTNEHIFPKGIFKYMYTSYSSGATGSIYVYFAAEGNIVDPDLITITVTKDFLGATSKYISQSISSSGYHEIKIGGTTGIAQHITAMTYTAG